MGKKEEEMSELQERIMNLFLRIKGSRNFGKRELGKILVDIQRLELKCCIYKKISEEAIKLTDEHTVDFLGWSDDVKQIKEIYNEN